MPDQIGPYTLSNGGSGGGGGLSAPNVDLTAAGQLAFGTTSTDVKINKAASGVLAVQLGDGSGPGRLMVADAPNTSSPSIYGSGSANNGVGLNGGTVTILQGGNRRAAFTGTFNYGLTLAGGDALCWVPGTDAYSGTADTQISRPAAGTVSLDTTGNADGLAILKAAGKRLILDTSSATNPTIAQFPNAGDFGFHTNTVTGAYYFARNVGGTVKSVLLT